MSRGLRFVLFTLGFLAATGLEAARADEGFLCPGGKIVYVPFGKLEEMKRTNPCVASHFAAEPAPTQTAPQMAPQTSLQSAPQTIPQSLAAGQPAGAAPPRDRASAVSVPVRLKTLHDVQSRPERVPDQRRVAAVRVPPRAAEGTDYRNIKVLNAADAGAHVYQHLD